MQNHTFAICAYQDSPYLEECIKSVKKQSVFSDVILCTSTPSLFLEEMANAYELPYYVREGSSNIRDDWNFAYDMAVTPLVTIAHQDDKYHRDYARTVRRCWHRYPDTTVLFTDCATLRKGVVEKPGRVAAVKKLLRLPLRLRRLADRTLVKRSALVFGNPIICPSCTYNKHRLGDAPFQSQFDFALDWEMMWKLAARPGRFVCIEKCLMLHRIHAEAATKANIMNHRRAAEEMAMYRRIWPRPIAALLMHFYRKAYDLYEEI